MSKFFRLPLTILALTIAGPVLAAEPAATSGPNHNTAMPGATANPAANSQATVTPKTAMVDINNASAMDLKALPGITDADAAKIVQGRPYKETQRPGLQENPARERVQQDQGPSHGRARQIVTVG